MRKLIIFIVILFAYQISRGQATYNYRFWYDDDSATLHEGTLSEDGKVSFSVNDLDGWLHNLHFQVCDNTGKWSPAVTRSFMLVEDSSDVFSEGATYRYWIDDNAASVVTGDLTSKVMPLSLPVNDLTGWLHYLHFQVCDNTGKWSPAVTRSFMLVEDSTDVFSEGATYRYWIDDDAASVVTGNLTSKVMPLTFSVDGLDGWLHNLHFQVCDNTGKWSPAVTRPFMLVEDSTDVFAEGATYRYWIDDDAASVVTGNLTSKVMPLTFSVDGLDGWLHNLHFQVCDNTGKWSPAVTRFFAIVPDYSDRFNDTTKFCYWIDDQPANVINGTENGNIMELNLPIDTLSATEHTLYLQVQDKFGLWSSVVSGTFTLTTSALTIMATGNGIVRYETGIIRDEVKDYETTVGNQVELTITPDEGYSISHVIVNGTEDVTDQVVDNKVSIYATETMSVEVTFELTDFTKLGDVNNDGRVSVADLSLSVNYLVGGHPSPFVLRQADANNDGEVNVGDVTRIVDLITGAVERGRHAPALHRDSEVREGNVLMGQIYGSLLNLDLSNSAEYTAFQLSLTLPEGTDVNDIRLYRDINHVLASGVADNGQVKLVVYSGDNSILKGTTGQLLQVQMTKPVEGDVLVNEIAFVTKQGAVHKFSPIRVSGTTGIAAKSEAGTRQQTYDLNGRPVLAKPKRGIYIIGGKKIIFK